MSDRLGIWRMSAKLHLVLTPMIVVGLTSMATVTSGGKCACGGYSARIVDESRSMDSRSVAVDLADVTDMNFKEFVGAVSHHVQTTVCADAGDTEVQLLFIRRPLVRQGGEAADNLRTADKQGGPDLRRLDSPWVK